MVTEAENKYTGIALKIHERANSFLTDKSSPSYKGLVEVIENEFLPNLPSEFQLDDGALNAYPGTLMAVFNYIADLHGDDRFLSAEMDLVTDEHLWYDGFKRLYDQYSSEIYQIASEKLHIVSYPLRITPLQYLLAPLGENLTVVDMGAAGHIALPLMNSTLLLEQNFTGKDEVLETLGNRTSADIKMGMGVELVAQNEETHRWIRAGFWRGPNRIKRLDDYEESMEIAEQNRQDYPIVQANAMDQFVKPGSIDAISSIFTLHQLPSQDKFFENCHRALKPGGILMVIGSELVGEFKPTDYPGWRVDVYKNTTEGLQYHSTPFYLTEDQVTIDRVDQKEWERYLGESTQE